MYGKPTGEAGRLGLVIGKKFAPRAVTRNLVKRLAREAFRLRRAEFAGWDILLRLHTRFDRKAMPSAASAPLAALCEGEIRELLDRAVREIARRGAAPAGGDTRVRTVGQPAASAPEAGARAWVPPPDGPAHG
ncbi:MAG: Ribonuclease P protein component [Burkholderia gladioli]|nr:MAG: Ribonuclease P protein component [Burkholderia gladioli]